MTDKTAAPQDVVKRLRASRWPLNIEAADEIERLRTANKALVEALLPLARRAETPGADKMWDNDRVTMFMKDARNARAALAAAQAQGKEGTDGN